MPSIKNHKYYLILAHNYSLKFLGNTYPNPSVGCIIVDYNSNKNGFLGIDNNGLACRVSTTGNKNVHIILRGSKNTPNYYPE